MRVRDSMRFRYLRDLLDGFVIEVPKSLVDDPSFDMLYRRLVACGAVVIGDGLLASGKTATHVIDLPDIVTTTVCKPGLLFQLIF